MRYKIGHLGMWTGAVVASLALAACGSSNSSSSSAARRRRLDLVQRPRDVVERGGHVGQRSSASAKNFKVGVVTDIGGLNDHGFNHLAYVGLLQAEKQLHITGRVLTSSSGADYTPNLTTLAQQGYNLVVPVGFLMADATDAVAKQFPKVKFAMVDSDADRREGRPQEHRGPALRGAAGRLPGRLPGRAVRQGEGLQDHLQRRRPEDPAGRPLHRRLPGRRQEGRPGHPDAQRVLAGLRRPVQVQADRAQPDPAGLQGRLPGGRRLRARRAVGRPAVGRPGHRGRRRPGLPGVLHPHLGREEGRRRGVQRDQGR